MQRVVLFAATAATFVQFTKNDITALQTLGCEIHMVCNLQQPALSDAALHDFNQTYSKLVWHDLPFQDSIMAVRKNRRATAMLEQLLTELKPALLHCHGTTAGTYGHRAVKNLGIPVFYTAHDFRVYRGCTLAERLVYGTLERANSKTTSVHLTVCPEDAAYVRKHLHAKTVVGLPDVGLDYDRYATPQRSALEVRQELQIPEDATVLLSVGALRMHKRLRIVLQAMTRLREQEQLHYVICGEGPDAGFLQKLMTKLHLTERVHLLGYRTDIPDILGAADIFCMPSRREGCGMAALEAMAAGLPLITVQTHGTKTYAKPDDAAFCLKGDLVTSCADAILQLSENKLLRRQMGAHNRVSAKAFADDERMMQMRMLYQATLDEK